MDCNGKCPECGSSWDGGLIVDTFKKMRDEGHEFYAGKTDEEIVEDTIKYYGSADQRWSRLIGIELPYDDPRHYDGVSYWHCPDCRAEWNRFTGKLENSGTGYKFEARSNYADPASASTGPAGSSTDA